MYRILLVDDDRVILEGMRHALQGTFEVAGLARNGKEAIDILQKTEVNIIITDISMPEMNGLELIDIVHHQFPRVKVIVLSNYDDFILIKDAMRLGAIDYLRKNEVTSEALAMILKSLPEHEMNQHLIGVDKANILEHTKPWSDAIKGRPIQQAKAAMHEFGAGRLIPIVIRFQTPISATIMRPVRIQLDDVKVNGWLQMDDKTWMQVVEIQTCSDLEFQNLWSQVLIRIASQFNEYRVFCHYFGLYSDRGVKEEALIPELIRMGQRLDCVFYEGYDRLLSIANCPPHNSSDGHFFSEWTSRLIDISRFERENLSAGTKLFFHEVQERRFVPEAVCKNCRVLIMQLLKSMGQEPDEYERLEAIERAGSLSDLESTVNASLDKALQNSRVIRADIGHVLEYIHKNYSSEISLEKAAQICGMSRNHFCRLFKKETGYSFVEYINRYRIERAKHLLMEGTLKTYEVADHIGIPNYRYFASLFRRYTGKQPGEYRLKSIDSII